MLTIFGGLSYLSEQIVRCSCTPPSLPPSLSFLIIIAFVLSLLFFLLLVILSSWLCLFPLGPECSYVSFVNRRVLTLNQNLVAVNAALVMHNFNHITFRLCHLLKAEVNRGLSLKCLVGNVLNV